jgi:ABC-type glycerol-3-phosphate transport system substrate-binding protein
MNRQTLRAALAASLAAGGLLAGCGGDDSSPMPPPVAADQAPASAAASDTALEAFAIAQAPSETAEPLKLDLVPTLPASETEEPIAVN